MTSGIDPRSNKVAQRAVSSSEGVIKILWSWRLDKATLMLLVSVTKSKLCIALGMSDLICGAQVEDATLQISDDARMNRFEACSRVLAIIWSAVTAE